MFTVAQRRESLDEEGNVELRDKEYGLESDVKQKEEKFSSGSRC